ncbi:hypothetical protein A2160_05435, partial [Candidatus Beckwithbacteria bacterium RBG_13_42_9]
MDNFWNYDPLKKRKALFAILFTLVFLVGFYLRVHDLTQSPPGFYLDEASIGYNAYSILKTGKDEYGVVWPLFFRAFGEYKNPVFIYSLVPMVALGGLNIETIRLGAVVWGSLAILLLGWLAIEMSENRFFELITALTLVLAPWHLHFSRIAYEAITLPTLLIASLASWIRWRKTKNISWGIGFAIFWVLSFYSYTAARLWLPLILFLILVLERKRWLKKFQQSLVVTCLILFFLGLLFFWNRAFPGSLTLRLNQLAIWGDGVSLKIILARFWGNFWAHWHPAFLFDQGDLTIRSSSRVSSELLKSWAPFLVLGLIAVIKHLRKKTIWQLTLSILVLFPMASALTKTGPHAIRTFQAVPFFCLFISLGIYWFLKIFRTFRFRFLVWISIWLVTFLEFSHYYQHLLSVYPAESWLPQHG